MDSPRDSIDAGIGMVHQHFMLVPVFTVAENVVLGDEPTEALGWLDKKKAREEVLEISARVMDSRLIQMRSSRIFPSESSSGWRSSRFSSAMRTS